MLRFTISAYWLTDSVGAMCPFRRKGHQDIKLLSLPRKDYQIFTFFRYKIGKIGRAMGVWPCSQHICFQFLSLLWWHQDCSSASCLQCSPAGLTGLWPHVHAGKYLVAVMGHYMIQLKSHRISWSRRIFIIGIGVNISHKVLWWFPDLFWIATRGSLHLSCHPWIQRPVNTAESTACLLGTALLSKWPPFSSVCWTVCFSLKKRDESCLWCGENVS